MSSTSVKNPVSVVNDASYGDVPWVGPDGFRVPNFGQASVNIPVGQRTNYARAAFDLPDLDPGLVLVGIQGSFFVRWTTGEEKGFPRDGSARIASGGSLVGSDRADVTSPPPIGSWGLSLKEHKAGGPTDLWDTTLTTADLIANGLELLYSAAWDHGNPDAAPNYGPAKIGGDEMRLTLYFA